MGDEEALLNATAHLAPEYGPPQLLRSRPTVGEKGSQAPQRALDLACLGMGARQRQHRLPLFDAFISTGLTIPDALRGLPRTLKDDLDDLSDGNFRDQIAWFSFRSGALVDLTVRSGGNFDFQPDVYTNTQLNRTSISFSMSDQLPLWDEFAF